MLIREETDEELPKIGMLLDIANLYGESTGRLTPWLICALGAGLPVIIYMSNGMWTFFPIWLFVLLDVLFALRLVMIFPGRERYRKELFKKKLYSKYMATADLLGISAIHEDGLLEYANGKVAYIVCCFNKTTADDVRKSLQVRKILQLILTNRNFDIHILNLNDSPALKQYYKKAVNFDRTEAVKNFIGIVDHMRDVVSKHSNLQCTCYVVYDFRSNWKMLRDSVNAACSSKAARCYKSIYVCSDPSAVNEILNRDIDSIVNVPELTRDKYATEQYDTSKVIAYDVSEDDIIIQGKSAVAPVIKDKSSTGFHRVYKEIEDDES